MLIVVGRAAIFVNMTEGRSYYEDLVAHNICQARDRMNDWASGLSIKGANQWRQFEVSWSDIDHIALISVVDGRYAGCERHDLSSQNLDPKVRLCATVTASVMRALASKGGGARDLLAFCQAMSGLSKLTPAEGEALLDTLHTAKVRSVEDQLRVPTRIGPFDIGGRTVSAFQFYMLIFTGMRGHGSVDVEAFSDLDWSEVALTAAFLTESTVEMESAPTGQIRTMRFGSQTKFLALISSNMDEATRLMPQILEEAKQARDEFVLIVNLHAIGPICMAAGIVGTGGKATEHFLSGF